MVEDDPEGHVEQEWFPAVDLYVPPMQLKHMKASGSWPAGQTPPRAERRRTQRIWKMEYIYLKFEHVIRTESNWRLVI